MSLRVLIVDDEPLARRGIRVRLQALSDIIVLEECEDGESAVNAIERLSPNLVFLDVQMPGMSGFDVLGQISKNRMPFIVFLTAYDQYALRAFEVNAVDYLLKPIDDERFAAAIKHARTQIGLVSENTLEERLRALIENHIAQFKTTTHADRFAIRTGNRTVFVLADEIDWIEASGDYAGLHIGHRTLLLRETLTRLETRLDPSRFVRIHRSTIVQAARIRELQTLPNREFRVRLLDGTELRASRSYRDRLDRWLL